MLESQEGTSVKTGYQFMIYTLSEWGITHYAGVTGGGVIHFLQYLQTYKLIESSYPNFMTLGEYSAGFVPLGHFLASGRVGAAVATTGAATKLLGCGLSDAKSHDIPAVFIVAQSDFSTYGLAPLQDTSVFGSNMIEQLRCELPNGIFVLDNPARLADQLNEITIDNLGWQSINENKTSAVTPFSIGINKCTDTDLQKSIKLTWKSNQLTAVGENYFLTTQGDSGALLGLIDQNGHPVIWNKPMTLGTVSMVDSTQKFDFGVYVRKPSTGEIKVGDFAGTVTFTVEYE